MGDMDMILRLQRAVDALQRRAEHQQRQINTLQDWQARVLERLNRLEQNAKNGVDDEG